MTSAGATFVVLQDAVAVFNGGGQPTRQTTMPRRISAAIEGSGSGVVVMDPEMFTLFDPDLGVRGSGQLKEPCASAVIWDVALICGSANDDARVFTSYQLDSGFVFAASEPHSHRGLVMTRSTGRRGFVTTSDSWPPNFHFFAVTAGYEVVYINESPCAADLHASDVMAFEGNARGNVPPYPRLITDTGLFLRVDDPACTVNDNRGCFQSDGALGSVEPGLSYVAMDTDSQGKLYGLVKMPGKPNGAAESPYLLQRVDVASRKIESQKRVLLDVGTMVRARHDPISNRLIVGFTPASPTPRASALGYRVVRLPYD